MFNTRTRPKVKIQLPLTAAILLLLAGGGLASAAPNVSYATAVAVQSDGKIVAAGTTTAADYSTSAFAAARYNSDGTLDQTFGIGGIVITNFGAGASFAQATAVAIQSDGKIVVAGMARPSAGVTSASSTTSPSRTIRRMETWIPRLVHLAW